MQGNAFLQIEPALFLGHGFVEIRPNDARCDTIDPHIVVGEFAGKGAGQLREGSLDDLIGDIGDDAADAGRAGHENDGSLAALAHARQCRPGEMKHRVQVGIEGAVPDLRRDIKQPPVDRTAGTMHEYIQASEAFDGGTDQIGARFRYGAVARQGLRLAPEGADLGDHGRAVGIDRSTVDDNVSAVARQSNGGGSTNAACSTCNKGYFSGKIHGLRAKDCRMAGQPQTRDVPRRYFPALWTLLGALLTGMPTAQGESSRDITVERIFDNRVPTGDYKHPASITELANGDLYLAFFSGRGEYKDNAAAVFGSRQKKGRSRWSTPAAIARNPFHALGNAVPWQAPDGVAWLFYVSRYGELWDASRISAKISRDGARTWSEAFMLTFEAGTMVRNRPIVLPDGDYLLPVYHEIGDDPEAVSANCTSFFLRYNPASGKWTESNRVRSRLGNIQPAPAVIEGNHLVAFCRRGGNYEGRPDGWLVRTESHDGGRTWSPGTDSEFPNPNAAVDFLRLQSGHHLLIYNNSFTNRSPLTAALSVDGAKTFPYRRDLVVSPTGDFGYPTAIQTQDGRIHVIYTSHGRTVIEKAVFEEATILRQP